MTIWDVHCHLSGVDGATVHERMAQLMAYADRMGVERMCFFMGWPWHQDPTPEQLRHENDQVLEAISHWHDRAFGFVYVSGKYPDFSIEEIDRCVKNGPMVGVKLWVAQKCSAPELDRIIKHAASLKAVIFQHTWFKVGGNYPGESTPLDMAELASRHPNTPMICGHTGGDWELGIRAIRRYENVSIGIGGFDPTNGVVEMAVRELGARRVLYGSDIGGRSFSSQLSKVYGARITNAEKELILAGNLQRMLKPILTSKSLPVR